MTGEKIFIFGITKLAHGLDSNLLCLNFFGGSSKQWTYAYPWFLRFVENRFAHVVGIEVLRRFVPHFPYFAKKIAGKLNKPRTRIDPIIGVATYIPGLGLDVNFYWVFAFLDGF